MDNVETLTMETLKQEFNELESKIDNFMDQKMEIPSNIVDRIIDITTELSKR